jgi:hypothetical protein
MEYLGLTIDTREMTVKIPKKKMKELLVLIREVAFSKKVTLCGILAFCTRAIPAGRAFSRCLYMATSKASNTHILFLCHQHCQKTVAYQN